MFKYFHKGFQYLNFFGGTSKKKPCTKSNLPPGLQCLRKWRFRVWGAGENICNWFLDYRNSVFVSQVVLSMESSSLPTPLSPLHSSPTRAATPPLLHSTPLQVVSMLAAIFYKMFLASLSNLQSHRGNHTNQSFFKELYKKFKLNFLPSYCSSFQFG